MSISFLDTEFVEDGEIIMPISLGLVPLDERRPELYLEFDFDEEVAEAQPFVRENVLPHLRGQQRYTREEARAPILSYFGLPQHPAESKQRIEVWAYFSAYDWVVFCQIFGPMVELPPGLPRLSFDLQQLYLLHGAPVGATKPPKPTDAHDALADARWNREFYLAMVGSRGC